MNDVIASHQDAIPLISRQPLMPPHAHVYGEKWSHFTQDGVSLRQGPALNGLELHRSTGGETTGYKDARE